MSIDITGLTEIKGQRRQGWATSYFINDSGECLAKHCSVCKEILPASSFTKGGQMGLNSNCRSCGKVIARAYRKTVSERGSRPSQSEYHRRRREKNYARSDEEIREDQRVKRPTGTKMCRACRVEQPLAQYSVDRSRGDGLVELCKPCAAVRNADYRTRPYLEYWISKGIPLECYVCGGEWVEGHHSDHVIPESLGGPDDPHNRLPLCPNHNTSKNGSPLSDWVAANFEEHEAHEIMHRVVNMYGVWPYIPGRDIIWDLG